jgi:hypothetical protein
MFSPVVTDDTITSNLNLIGYREDVNDTWWYRNEWEIKSSENIWGILQTPIGGSLDSWMRESHITSPVDTD